MLRKQVRFDTPRRSDPRLYRHPGMECHSPRTPLAPLAPSAPSAPQNVQCVYREEPVSGERDNLRNSFPYPQPERWRPTRLPIPPSSDLELSGFEDECVGSFLKNVDGARPHPVKTVMPSFPERPIPCDKELTESAEMMSPPNKLQDSLKNLKCAPELWPYDAEFQKHIKRKAFDDDKGFFIRPDRPVDTFTLPFVARNTLKTRVECPNILKEKKKNEKRSPNRPVGFEKHCNCLKYNPKCMKENDQRKVYNPQLNSNCCHTCSPSDQRPQQFYHSDPLELSFPYPCVTVNHPTCLQHQQCSHSTELMPQQKTCSKSCCSPKTNCPRQINLAEVKSKAIEKYEMRNKSADDCTEIENLNNVVSKDTKEPTVADLFTIIKLQNEQLKLLQDRVDKLLDNSHSNNTDDTSTQLRPVQNVVQECVSVETVDETHHKISIGVMTSFEMYRTSFRNTGKNASQIQCNKSQVSIKEVISTKERNLNFLDGILPVDQCRIASTLHVGNKKLPEDHDLSFTTPVRRYSRENEDKTVNELSLCNIHIDNATTPQLSPDQTLYLDVKDYSGSEIDEQSNVGWTYYNKVMNHVNTMLQDSQVPSSAAALHRQTVERCARLHVDRTDVSVTTSKRVTFNQNPVQLEPPRPYTSKVPSSDTSLQMNRLAAKYLNGHQAAEVVERPVTRSPELPLDMSLATRRYMEHHNLIQAKKLSPDKHPQHIPTKILDITALKQQPKLL